MSDKATATIAASITVFIVAGAAWAQPAEPALSPAESFNSDEVMSKWSFSNGAEWPGATGELRRYDSGGRTHDGVLADGMLALRYNFEKGGHYVAAMVQLPAGRKIEAVRMWLNKPADNVMIFRAKDAEGETFQKNFRYDFRGWQQVEISLDGWVHHWSGDGVFQHPARQLDILIENQGGTRVGELLIDDIQWVYQRTPPAESNTLTTPYTESDFSDDDGWHTDGPEFGTLRGGAWAYTFPNGSDVCALRWGKSILGRPTALRLTLESDGSGHEIVASCGSHFQGFRRSLGRLDSPGVVTLEVPMGDMRTWEHFGGENDGIVRYPVRLENLALVKHGDDSGGRITLKRMEFVTEHDREDPIVLIPRVRRKGDGGLIFTVRLRSLHDKPVAGVLRYSLNTLDQTLETGSTTLTVSAGGEARFEHATSFGEFWMLEGRFKFVSDEFSTSEQSTTIAREPVPPAQYTLNPESRMGVGMYLYRFHSHPDRKAWMERMCRLAAAAGVKWTREEFHWSRVEPVRGQFDFSFYDELVDVATAHGISVYGLVCYWTDWTGPPTSEDFIEPYCDYLRVIVTRYKGRIRHWEIWNEPNIFFWPGPKELYAKLLRRAYETIKAVDPDIEVLGCSTSGIDVSFIQKVLDAGAPFDALTIHPYRGSIEPAGFIKELRDTREMVGGRDVWITEMGWPSNIGGLTEREQAGYVARTYITSLASGAVRSVSWYDFREDGTDPFYNEHHFGLIRNDLTPKAGYQALAAVGRLIGAAEFERVLDLAETRADDAGRLVGYQFRNGDRRIAAIWSPDRTRLASFDIKGEGVRILNAGGDPAYSDADGRRWIVRLERDLPIYVTAGGDLKIEWKEWPVRIVPRRAAFHPGDTIDLELDSDASTNIWMDTLPPGLSGGQGKHGKGTNATTRIRIAVSPDAAPGRRTIRFPIKTPGGVAFDLPVKVEVVPLLLRG